MHNIEYYMLQNINLCHLIGPLLEPNPNSHLIKMWQSNPKLCWNVTTQSSSYSRTWPPNPIVVPERGNPIQCQIVVTRQRSPVTYHKHNHKYIIRIIYLHHDFIATIIKVFHLQQVLLILHHSNIKKYHNEARINKHHTIIQSQPSPTNYSAIPIIK